MSIGRRFPPWFNAVLVVLAVAGAVALVLLAVVWLTPVTWDGIADGVRRYRLTPKQGAGVVVALGVLVAAGAARARWSTRGPMTIHEVKDATGGSDELCLQVAAILRDRMARAGVQPRGVVPSYSGVDVGGSDLVSSSPVNASGLITKLLFSLLQFATSSPGWWVDATIRRSERGETGLTVVVQHVATGRHDLVETVWDETPQRAARRAAYVVAAWHLGRHASPSSRRRPTWRPGAEALRHYEDAVFFSSRRRFDDALRSARAGLGVDPSNLTLRRVLGETYERLGHWFSALHTYATGVVMLLDRDNGWSRTVLDGSDPDHPDRHWPRRRFARRRVRSDEAAGIVWRYVAVLTFADQWVDRWIRAGRRLG